MLAAELTPRTARAQQRRRAADAVFVAEHEQLLVLLTTLRAASAESLHALHFNKRPAPTSLRQTYRALRRLEDLGYLERQHLQLARTVYRLAAKGYASSPRVHRRATDSVRKPLPEAIGGYCWLRSAIWAELTNRGYSVGRGLPEQLAVRRYLVDRQRAAAAAAAGTARAAAARVLDALRADPALTPLSRSICPTCGTTGAPGQAIPVCPRCTTRPNLVTSPERFHCPRCGALSDRDEPHTSAATGKRRCESPMREVDHVDFDVAWRPSGSGVEVVLIVVDNPVRTVREQLDGLPLRTAGQPKIPIVLRTTDPHSSFDPRAARWIATGERHRELLRAFSEEGHRHLFPFSLTANVIDVRPELQLRLRSPRKEESHA